VNYQAVEQGPSVRTVEPIALTVEQAARAAGVGRTSLYAELKAGRLRATKACGRTLIMHCDLVAWLEACRDQTAARAS
jgi:excisionase family DNA binding protein